MNRLFLFLFLVSAACSSAELTTDRKVNSDARPVALFLGSSSIEKWLTMNQDFPELETVNAGKGGSTYSYVSSQIGTLMSQHHPEIVVLYSGDNDLVEHRKLKSILNDIRSAALTARRSNPNLKLYVLSVKPSPARINLIDRAKILNSQIQIEAETTRQFVFVDIFPAMLDPQGFPRPELFVEDGVHLNAQGYAIWRSLLRRQMLSSTNQDRQLH